MKNKHNDDIFTTQAKITFHSIFLFTVKNEYIFGMNRLQFSVAKLVSFSHNLFFK